MYFISELCSPYVIRHTPYVIRHIALLLQHHGYGDNKSKYTEWASCVFSLCRAEINKVGEEYEALLKNKSSYGSMRKHS